MTSKIDGVAGHIEVSSNSVKHTAVGAEMKDWLTKFHDIEEKNKCLRVQFLDWLSDKFLDWSNRLHETSVRIDSPCIIKVEPRKKEDAITKDEQEIRRLRELLEDSKRREKEFADKMKEKAL